MLIPYIQINVGCRQSFQYDNPVRLEYSHDAGVSWRLVHELCHVGDQCHENHYTDGTVYQTGTYASWTTVVLPVTAELSQR